MDDPHTVRVWGAAGFIALGAAEILVVATIHAVKRELSRALDQLELDMAGRPRMPAIWRLIYGAGFLAVRHTGVGYALGAFSIMLGATILVLEHLYGG
ncbi:MAG: hypothetical protein QOF68_1524 [Gaiellales bacterium]|jgi:hypothetical protein|nr:hypothetical protein [Gaiellales bacterium]